MNMIARFLKGFLLFFSFLFRGKLILRICIGIILGLVVSLISQPLGIASGFFGDFFVKALQSVAPVLVFV